MRKPLMSKTQNVCLILLAGLFFALGCIMVNQLVNNKKDKETEYKEIALDSDEVKKAISNWDIHLCMGADVLLENIYSGNFKTEEISNDYLLFLALESFDNIPTCTVNNDSVDITIEKLNNNLNKIIKNKSLSKEDIISILNNSELKEVYNISLNENTLKVFKECFECKNNTEGTLTSLEDAKINNKYLVINQRFAYGKEVVEGNNLMIDYYKDLKGQNFVERLSQDDAGKLNWEEYNLYKFTFIIDGENYLLKSVTK